MTLEELAAARNEAAKNVSDWMRAEGGRGRLRRNDQSPYWADYETAQKALDDALAAVGPSGSRQLTNGEDTSR